MGEVNENEEENMSVYNSLAEAILNHDLPKVKRILKKYEFESKTMKYLLQLALNDSTEEISKELVKKMNDFELSWLMCADGSYHQLAIDKQWPSVLELMVARGATFRKYDSIDVNPMHYAAQQKDPIYAKILGKVVQPDFYYGEELTPLMVAAENGNDETMDALLSLGADPVAEQKPRVRINNLVPSMVRAFFVVSTMTTIDSVIHKAAYSGNPKTVDVLLKYRPTLDLNKFGTDLKTPLMIAAENGHKEMVHHLLKLGADVNHQCTYKSALHYAVDANSTEIAKLLLEYGIHQKSKMSGPSALETLLSQNRRYGIQNPELVDLLRYAQAHPQKVISQKPTYFPGRDPRGSRSRND